MLLLDVLTQALSLRPLSYLSCMTVNISSRVNSVYYFSVWKKCCMKLGTKQQQHLLLKSMFSSLVSKSFTLKSVFSHSVREM